VDWYDKAEQEIDDDLERGFITAAEHRQALRELRQEYQEHEREESGNDFY
jgi:hypothetical protein